MELAELYDLANMYPDFSQFEQHVKAKMTGEPITQKINCELRLVKVIYKRNKYINPDKIIGNKKNN